MHASYLLEKKQFDNYHNRLTAFYAQHKRLT